MYVDTDKIHIKTDVRQGVRLGLEGTFGLAKPLNIAGNESPTLL